MTVQTQDQTVSGKPRILQVTNGTLVNNNNGTFSLTTGGGGGGGYNMQPTTVTLNVQYGMTVSTLNAYGTNGSITISTPTLGTFYQPLFAGQAKYFGPNFPASCSTTYGYISNSTSELNAGDYYDNVTTQCFSWSFPVHAYDGRQLYADVEFHMSIATTNYTCWGVYTSTMTPNYSGAIGFNASQDAPSYSVKVTTAVVVPGTALAPARARVALTNTTAHDGDWMTVVLERETGGCGNAESASIARMDYLAITENE